MNLTLFARLKKFIKSLSTYHSPLPKAEATWSVTLDRSAMPIKVAAGVVRCLCSDSRISRAVTWPSCARRTVGMSTEHCSWSVAPWYYLQPEFPKSDPFNYTRHNFQFVSKTIYQRWELNSFYERSILKFEIHRRINPFVTLHFRFLLGRLRIKLQNVMDVKTCAPGHLEALQNSTTER